MKEFQEIDSKELEKKFRDLSYWTKMHAGKLLERVQRESSAKIIKDGISKIVTYYDEHAKYLCTMHIVVTKEGVIIHEDFKDAYLHGIWYRCI